MSDVAVLLATYNGEKYIAEQLDSLLNQTYQDFICYIHDDGSKDQTIQICQEYKKMHPGKFKILDYAPTGGAKNNFLSLMKNVDAELVMFCDQDDVWLPNKIEEMMEAVRSAEGDFLAFSDLKIVDEQLNVLEDSFYQAMHIQVDKINYKNALIKGFIPGCTMMVNRELIQKALNYKNECNIKMHDWWLVIMALITDARMIFVNKQLGFYRQHSTNTIGAKEQSTVDRVRFNLKRILDGTLRVEKKKNLSTPRLQAQELYETGIGSEDKRQFVKQYAEIGKKNKISRIGFYLKNFQDVYRMWWMVLWV